MKPTNQRNYRQQATDNELASDHKDEVKRSKPRPEFSHSTTRENDKTIRKAAALKMTQPDPGGPKTRKLFVKLIDIMKNPIVPVTVPVPTRKRTLSTNINALNVQKGIPISIDLTVDEDATLMTNNGLPRGIAQIKAKEKADQCRDEGTAKKPMKTASKKKAVDEYFTETSESEASDDVFGQDPWQSDSGQDTWKGVPVESDVESEESDHELEFFKSDHEFSEESVDETPIVPMKRARTAHNDNENEIEGEWCACQKCKMHNNPESILLCDKCDLGYHTYCLVPMLFTIPEGDWFCAQCQQEKLIKSLQNLLKNLDKGLIRQKALEKAKKVAEIKRQKRKEFASLNMLPDETVRKKSKRKRATAGGCLRSNTARGRSNRSSSGGSSPTGSSNSCSDNNKPAYKLRERGHTKVNYRFAEYDDLIKSPTSDEKESDTKSECKTKGASDSVLKPTRKTQKRELGKKNKKLNSLDTETDDDGSDDSFRGTSCSEDDQDDNFSAGSGNDSDS
ncbi:hypothetical protein HA402_008005 [Bradysia odoriphaga]|nr:hypothetical protein HA402_008005 [Bradysia odoriphaga]